MGRRIRVVGTLFGMILVLGLIVIPATADTPTCKDHGDFSQNLEGNTSGDWGSIEFTPDSGPLVLTVEEGWEVLLCVKKGSGVGGDPHGGPVTVGPYAAGSHEVHYPTSDEGFSHYDFIAGAVVTPGGEDALELELVKVWELPDGVDEDDVSAAFTIDDDPYTTAVEVGDGDELTIAESVGGVNELGEECSNLAFWGVGDFDDLDVNDDMTSFDGSFPYTVAEDHADGDVITITVLNIVECETVLGGGETQTGSETTTTTTEETVEVLGVEQVRPSGVPAGTGGHLPATGAQGLLLLLLTGLGLTFGGITLRRMSA